MFKILHFNKLGKNCLSMKIYSAVIKFSSNYLTFLKLMVDDRTVKSYDRKNK